MAGIPGQRPCWTTAWTRLGRAWKTVSVRAVTTRGGQNQRDYSGGTASKASHFLPGYRGSRYLGLKTNEMHSKCKCVLVCVSKSLWLLLKRIVGFLSSRMEGGSCAEGGNKDGSIERRTRKTKIYIGDSRDEELKPNDLLLCFPRVHFLSYSPQDGFNSPPTQVIFIISIFLPFLLLLFCFSAISV